MPITTEEAQKIKEHLLTQLDNFPEDKRSQITEQINSMTDEQVEAFVKQNNLNHLGGQCIFCAIVANKTPSHKISEDNSAVAILELNPLSKGHTLIVPKEHLEKVPDSCDPLAQEIKNKLQKKFSPKDIKINELKIMDHALLEVVPIYGDETERHQASEEELKSLQEEILKPSEEIIQQPTEEIKPEEIPTLPPRIP
ncbi:HIT domain-containing protein [Methanococcoides sp. SA1]|nr:HIT domain-containing protein [Methanococcoides sp. SA1]